MNDFSEQLNQLKRKTNLNGRELAEDLGIKSSYFSQLLSGKKEPSEPIRKAVERMLAAPTTDPGMRALYVELPERLYIAAHNAAEVGNFRNVSEYVSQLIRDDTKAIKPFLPSTVSDSRTSQEILEKGYAEQRARLPEKGRES